MKTFKEYLAESKKQWPFRIKIAGAVTSEQESAMRSLLGRFTESETLGNIKKSKTPIQALPLDFPQVRNCEVNIYEVTLDYPTTQQELTEYLSTELGINKQNLVVRNPNEPSEEYQHIEENPREGALLNDPNYSEAGSPKFDDYYGSKYNSGFVQELNDILKLQRKERGEIIPESRPDDIIKNPGQTLNDIPTNTTSPIPTKQSDYKITRK
jgi:hypothetical protein